MVGYSPFGSSRFRSPESAGGNVLSRFGEKHGKTPRQVALNFLTRQPEVFTILKASHVDHVRENAGGAGWSLTEEDLRQIDEAFPAPSRDMPLGML